MSTDPDADPSDYVDVLDFQSPDADQPTDTLEHMRVRNGDEPDELTMIPTDATEIELLTTWVTASGEESFTDLDEAR